MEVPVCVADGPPLSIVVDFNYPLVLASRKSAVWVTNTQSVLSCVYVCVCECVCVSEREWESESVCVCVCVCVCERERERERERESECVCLQESHHVYSTEWEAIPHREFPVHATVTQGAITLHPDILSPTWAQEAPFSKYPLKWYYTYPPTHRPWTL